MEDVRGELLTVACSRIMALDRPAYIKDSELRFVAVNDAFVRFCGVARQDLQGLRSSDIHNGTSERDLEDKERRALVFGSEETSECLRSAFESMMAGDIEDSDVAVRLPEPLPLFELV